VSAAPAHAQAEPVTEPVDEDAHAAATPLIATITTQNAPARGEVSCSCSPPRRTLAMVDDLIVKINLTLSMLARPCSMREHSRRGWGSPDALFTAVGAGGTTVDATNRLPCFHAQPAAR
jgi:hypothetical protein